MAERKNLLKLIRHINMLNPNPKSSDPEYRLMEHTVSDDMVKIGLSMKLRTPMTITEIAKKSGFSVKKTRELTKEMAQIGIIEYEGDKLRLPLFAPGSMELMVMNKDFMDKHPEVAYAFKDYVEDLTKNFARFFPQGNGLVITLPVAKAIEAEPRKIDIDEISYWINRYYPSLAVTTCQCRRAAAIREDMGADVVGEWCIQLGEFAESCIRTNRSRRITKEEAYDILHRAEEMGYVHEVTNVDGPMNSLFICNCHPDSCLAFRTSRLVDTPNMMKSNYVASVDPTKCVACGECMEVCPMNAAKLGQKICQKNPVDIPENISPDDHVWGKDKWTLDFRMTKKDVIPETGTSPCKTMCPAHISVQAYLKLASQGRYMDALELIKKENPFPAVCGRICNHRCEDACTLGTVTDPVAIDDVKKFIAQQELESGKRFIPKKRFPEGEKLAIIGAGPAGLTAAYFAAINGNEVTVFEKEEKAGGMLRYGIPSFRLEKDIIDAEIDVIKQLGVTFKYGIEAGKDITIQQLRKQGYKAIYLAIGAQGGRKVGVPGEDAEGVLSGIDFLKSVNSGNTVDVTGKTVVIGGGNVAIDVARTALRTGSDEVSLFCLEPRDNMPASEEEILKAIEEKINVNPGWGPKRIIVKNDKVCGIELKKCISVIDKNGKFNPKYDENDTISISCDHVLLAVGQSIQWGNLLDGTKIVLNRNNTVKADGFTYQTAEDDIFVGGDAYTGPRFAVDAIAAGKSGADSLHRWSHQGSTLLIGRDHRDFSEIDKNNVVISSYDRPNRQKATVHAEKKLTFSDERGILTEEQIIKETSRCLECGAAKVDQTRCIGCGLCTTRCKFEAITLSKVSDCYGTTYEKLPARIGGAVVKRAGKIAIRKVQDARNKDK
ncbi:MAG: FAD-dependent oxidoreductase [Clostridiales bacterium]|nr:FAD-dependent oxidoreductase [Clostridiales bacterium]